MSYPPYSMWGQGGVWVPYPPASYMHQQGWRMSAGHAHNEPQCSIFSRLNYGQSSSRYARSIKLVLKKPANLVVQQEKTPTKQVYVPKKKEEVPVAPAEKTDKDVTIKISSADVPVEEIKGPIVFGNPGQSKMKKVSICVAANDHEAKSSKIDSKYFQPKCVFQV